MQAPLTARKQMTQQRDPTRTVGRMWYKNTCTDTLTQDIAKKPHPFNRIACKAGVSGRFLSKITGHRSPPSQSHKSSAQCSTEPFNCPSICNLVQQTKPPTHRLKLRLNCSWQILAFSPAASPGQSQRAALLPINRSGGLFVSLVTLLKAIMIKCLAR